MTEEKAAPEWTPEKIAECNAEMADYIIHECIELLSHFPCLHGSSNEVSPPMMLREAILCTINQYRKASDRDRALIEAGRQAVEAVRKLRWTCEDEHYLSIADSAIAAWEKAEEASKS